MNLYHIMLKKSFDNYIRTSFLEQKLKSSKNQIIKTFKKSNLPKKRNSKYEYVIEKMSLERFDFINLLYVIFICDGRQLISSKRKKNKSIVTFKDNNKIIFQEILFHCSSKRFFFVHFIYWCCLLYTSPSPRDKRQSRMPSSA